MSERYVISSSDYVAIATEIYKNTHPKKKIVA